MAIQPLTLASGGADDTGPNASTGDARHLAPGDALDQTSVSNTTRQLAQRDVMIASKLNDVINQVNNREQFIPLPSVRITLPPASQEVISNFRIPPGFEARILNAIVASVPAETARLSIFHNSDSEESGLAFGDTGGTSVVETADEFSGGTSFLQSGELVVRLTNEGTTTADLTASVILTMRPLGTGDDALLSPGFVGRKGDKGDKGDQGDKGNTGDTGPAGSAGLTPRGAYDTGADYIVNDIVTHAYSGQPESAWRAIAPNDHNAPVEPGSNSAVWEVFVAHGASGTQGIQGVKGDTGGTGSAGTKGDKGDPGDAGLLEYFGEWQSDAIYGKNQLVTIAQTTGSGIIRNTYIGNGSNINKYPPDSIANEEGLWGEIFTPAVAALYSQNIVYGTLRRGTSYTAGAGSGKYTVPPVPTAGLPNEVGVQFRESVSREVLRINNVNIANPSGIAHLQGQFLYHLNGSARITLPNLLTGAARNWRREDVIVTVVPNSGAAAAIETTAGTDEIGFQVTAGGADTVTVSVTGNHVLDADT